MASIEDSRKASYLMVMVEDGATGSYDALSRRIASIPEDRLDSSNRNDSRVFLSVRPSHVSCFR
jgi:hypothetical protein